MQKQGHRQLLSFSKHAKHVHFGLEEIAKSLKEFLHAFLELTLAPRTDEFSQKDCYILLSCFQVTVQVEVILFFIISIST